MKKRINFESETETEIAAPSVELLGQRLYMAYTLRKSGMTFKELGNQLGTGPQRARELYLKSERRLNRKPHWMDELKSSEACKVFAFLEIESREHAIEAWKSGKFKPGNHLRGYGVTTYRKIAKWLNMPDPAPARSEEHTSELQSH